MSDSDSDFNYPGAARRVRKTRRRREIAEMQLRSQRVQPTYKFDTDDDSDESPRNVFVDTESESEQPIGKRIRKPGLFDESSADSAGEGEKCPICFATLKEQEVGIPNACTHMYCAKCIEEWARDGKTCPIDRQTFSRLTILENIQSFKVVREVTMPEATAAQRLQPPGDNESEDELPLALRLQQPIIDEDSNHSTSSGEKCPICFANFFEQEIGVPDSCGHRYCGRCIEEWSRTVRTCPIDRQTFTRITILENARSPKKIREISVSHNPEVMVESELEDDGNVTYCTECSQSNFEESMLLCDSCNNGYHMHCLNPPLEEVPDGDWFCATCISCTGIETLFQTRRRVNRVRRTRTRRTRRTRSRRTCRIPLRSLLSGNNRATGAASNPESESGWDGPRLWERHRAEVPRLAVFGLRDELDYFVSDDESEDVATRSSGSVGILLAPPRSRPSTLQSRKRILTNIVTPQSTSVDLLSNILTEQETWHNLSRRNNIKNVRIGSDGTFDFSDIVKSDKPTTEKKDPPPETQAPMYPRGGRNSGGYFNNNNRGNRGNNFRNTSNYNYQGNTYQNNSNYNQFNRSGNTSNFGNFQNSGRGGGGNFTNTFQSFQFRNNNNNQNQRGRQQYNQRARGGPFTPNRFNNQRNQNRDNVEEDFSNNTMCSNRQESESDYIENVNESDGDVLNTELPEQTDHTDNVDNEDDDDESSAIETIQSSAMNAINSNYQDYEDECDNNENDEQEYDEEYPPNESCDFRYPNVTPILPVAPAPNYQERDEEEDDCPNFSVYSAEAMKLANNLNEPQNENETQLTENQEEGYEEAEEDLVQLDDDEENVDGRNEEQFTNLRQIPLNNDAPEEKDPQDLDNIPIPAPSLESIPIPGETPSTEPPVRREKKGVLELYDDSDWEELNLIKTNEDRPALAAETLPEEEEVKQPEEFATDPRSYTPCLDENNQAPEVHKEDDDDDTIDISANPMDAGGIGGMDTELISDEDGVLNNGNVTAEPEKRPEAAEKKDGDEKKGGGKSRGKKTKEFKKISRNNRDRNYRDRERGRDRSRSYSNDKENDRRDSYSKRKEKRKDLARYDVRNVVEDRWQRRGRKDQYGRDTSRHRSLSSSPKRNSYSRSPSRRRSMSFSSRSPRRSLSRGRQPHRRRSLSRNRRNRRSTSRRRSISRRRSPLRRRSFSRRRSLSRRRSPSRRRSFSRKRSLSRKRDRSFNRSASPRRFTRSRTIDRPARGSRSPAVSFRRSRSRISPRPPSRERVKQPKRKKTSKDGRNKMKKIKKKHISTEKHATPEVRGVVHKRKGPNVDEVSSAKKSKKSRSRSKSWNGEGSRAASFSMSPPPGENYEGDPTSWTPPLNDAVREEFAAQAQEPKMRKKEKKRKQEKKRGDERRSKRAEKQSASKEVFASGNNILVSVSFNNDEPQPPQQTISVTLPPTKDGLITKRKTGDSGAKKSRKEKSKRPSKGSRKKRIDSKPVAIIDLDRSPFKEMTPSPKAVIVLSDSDGGDNGENNKSGGTPRLREMDDVDSRNERREIISQSRSPNLEVESTFTLGPKTPPEPEHIKFTLKTKNKTKSTRPNVLADEDEEELPSEPEEIERHNSSESVNKIGPNTPPEPAPCSPDAYDPFEPTKSPSQSRSPIAPAENSESVGPETSDKSGQAVVEDLPDAAAKTQEKVMNPVDLVMALMNSTTHAQMTTDSHNTSTESQQSARISASPQEKPEEPKPSSSGITIISNVLIQPSKSVATSTPTTSSVTSTLLLMPPIQTQTGGEKSPAKLIATNVKPSPMKTPSVFTKTSSGSLISKLPLPKVGNQSGSRHNGDQDVIEMDSPYSPASSDFDGLFDPPAEQSGRQNMSRSANTSGQSMPKATPTKAATKSAGDIFDALFGGASPSAGNAQVRSQQKTKTTKTMARGQAKRSAIKGSKASTPIGLDEASMRIVDEVPGSAVELHFLRKLNRQERVVEEVKLVLKPHYNKKHITKDEYKDILRKAVPKICHSRTGEINPQKIQTLIEAYVRKFRIKRKISGSQPGTSGAAKNVKSLWA